MVKKTSSARPVSTIRTPERAQIHSSRARAIDPISRDTVSAPSVTKKDPKIRGVDSSPLDDLMRSRPSGDLGYEEKYDEIKSWIDSNKSVLQDPRYADEARRIIQSEQRKLDSKSQKEVQSSLEELKRIKDQSLPYDQSVAEIEGWLERNRSAIERSGQGVDETQRLIGEIDAEAEERNYQRAKEITSSFNSANLSYEEHSAQLNNIITTHGDLLGLGERNYALSDAFVQKELTKLEQKNLQELQRAKTALQLQGSYESKVESLNSWIEQNKDVLGRGDYNYEQSQVFIDKKVKEIEGSNIRDLESAFKSLKLKGSYSEQVDQLNTFIEDNEALLGRGEKNYTATQVFLKQKERELQAANSADFRDATRQLNLTGKSYTEQVEALQKWVEDYGEVLGRGENYTKTQEFLKQKESRFNQLNREEFQSAVSNLQLSGTYEEQADQLNQWVETHGDTLGRGDNYNLALDLIGTKEQKLQTIAKRDFESAKSDLVSQWSESDFEGNSELLQEWIEVNKPTLERPGAYDDAMDFLELKQSKLEGDYNRQFDSLIGGFQFQSSDYFTKSQELKDFVDANQTLLGYEDRFDEASSWLSGKQDYLDSFKQESFAKAIAKKPSGSKGKDYESALQSWFEENPVVTLEEFSPQVEKKIETEFQKSLEKQYSDALKSKPVGTMGGDYFSEVESWISNNPIVVSGDDFYGRTQQRIAQESEVARSNFKIVDNYTLNDLKTDNRFDRTYHGDGSIRRVMLKDKFNRTDRQKRNYTPLEVHFDSEGNVTRIIKQEIFPVYIDDRAGTSTSYSEFKTIDVEYNADGSVRRNRSQSVPPASYESDYRLEEAISLQNRKGRELRSDEVFEIWVRGTGQREINLFDPAFQKFLFNVHNRNLQIRADQKAAETAKAIETYGSAQFSKGDLTKSDDFFNLIADGRREIPISELMEYKPVFEDWSDQNVLVREIRDDFRQDLPSVIRPDLGIIEKAKKLEGDFALSPVALRNLISAGSVTDIQRQDIERRFAVQESLNKVGDLDFKLESFDGSDITEYNRNLVLRNLFASEVDSNVQGLQEIEDRRRDSFERLSLAEKAAKDVSRDIVDSSSISDSLSKQQRAKFELEHARRDYLLVGDLYGEGFADAPKISGDQSVFENVGVAMGNTFNFLGNVIKGKSATDDARVWWDSENKNLGQNLLGAVSTYGGWHKGVFTLRGARLDTAEERKAKFLDVSKSVPSERATIAATPGATSEVFVDTFQNKGVIPAVGVGLTLGAIRGVQLVGQGLQMFGEGWGAYSDKEYEFLSSKRDSLSVLPGSVSGTVETVFESRYKLQRGIGDVVAGIGDWGAYKPAEATFIVGLAVATAGAGSMIGSAGAAGVVKASALAASKSATPVALAKTSVGVGSKIAIGTASGILKGGMFGLKGLMVTNVVVKTGMAEEGTRARTFGESVAPLLGLKVGSALGKSALKFGTKLGVYDRLGTAKLKQIKYGGSVAQQKAITSELRRIGMDTTTGRTGISKIKGADPKNVVSVNQKFGFKDLLSGKSPAQKVGALKQSVKSDFAMVKRLQTTDVDSLKNLQTYTAPQIGPKMRGVTDLSSVKFKGVLKDNIRFGIEGQPDLSSRKIRATLKSPSPATVGGEPVSVYKGSFIQDSKGLGKLDVQFSDRGGRLFRIDSVSDGMREVSSVSESVLNKGLIKVKSKADLFTSSRPGFGVTPKAAVSPWTVKSVSKGIARPLDTSTFTSPAIDSGAQSRIVGYGRMGKKFTISPDQVPDKGFEAISFKQAPQQITSRVVSKTDVRLQTGREFGFGTFDEVAIGQKSTLLSKIKTTQELGRFRVADSVISKPPVSVKGSLSLKQIGTSDSPVRKDFFYGFKGEGIPESSVSVVPTSDVVLLTKAGQIRTAKSWISSVGPNPFSKSLQSFPSLTATPLGPATKTLTLGGLKVTAPKDAFVQTAELAGKVDNVLNFQRDISFNLGVKTKQVVFGAPDSFAIKGGTISKIGAGFSKVGSVLFPPMGKKAQLLFSKSPVPASVKVGPSGTSNVVSRNLASLEIKSPSLVGGAFQKFTPNIGKIMGVTPSVKIAAPSISKLSFPGSAPVIKSSGSLVVKGDFNFLGGALELSSFKPPSDSISFTSFKSDSVVVSPSEESFTGVRRKLPVSDESAPAPFLDSYKPSVIRSYADFELVKSDKSKLKPSLPVLREYSSGGIEKYSVDKSAVISKGLGASTVSKNYLEGFGAVDSVSSSGLRSVSKSDLGVVSTYEHLLGFQPAVEQASASKLDTMSISDTSTKLDSLLDIKQKPSLTPPPTIFGPGYDFSYTPPKPPKPPKIPIIDVPEFDLDFEGKPRKKKVKSGKSKKFLREFATLDLIGTSKKGKKKSSMMFL